MVDTYAHWSVFGQLVILVLIQIGGLGIITVASMIMILGKQKLYLRNRMNLNVVAEREKEGLWQPVSASSCITAETTLLIVVEKRNLNKLHAI